MKGGVVAALHALAALRRRASHPEVVLLAVASEEDGGLGAFAALERDAAFDACLIPEPTAFEVVCAQAGALTFRVTVRGRAAHAAMRLAGRSALDRYVGAAPRDPGPRARAQPRRRAPGDAGARAALPGQRRAHRRRRVVELGARPRDRRGPPRRAARHRRSPTPAPRSRPRSTTASRRRSRSSGPAASSRPARRRRSTRGSRRSPPRCAPSAAPRRASPACPTAPTCGCSAPAGSRP